MELNNLNDMTAFVASVKSGSFTAAAKQLGLTRSTIGKRIVRLEARLNVRLLQRNTRNLAPTDEGRLFYERCTAVLEELENAEQCLAQRSIEPQGRLKISAPLVLGKTILPPLLADFLHRYPQTSVELSLTDDYADLISDGYDLALRNGNPPQCDSLIARTVGSQQMLTCAAPGYLVQHGTPQSPDDLAHHQCLHFLHGGRVSRWRFQQKGKETTFQGSGRFSADNGEALLELALSAFGIVQLPHYLVQAALDAGSLKSVLSDFQPKPVPVMAVYPSRKQLSPKVRVLVDMMGEAWGKAV